MNPSVNDEYAEREKIEVELLLQAIYRMYGYDFRNYAYDYIRRRIRHGMQRMGEESIASLIPRVLYQPDSMQQLVNYFMVNVTEMFRDSSMYLYLSNKRWYRTCGHTRISESGMRGALRARRCSPWRLFSKRKACMTKRVSMQRILMTMRWNRRKKASFPCVT
ncbi:MCP methyltransferase, CheR-type [Paenibacillus vortex V453]|uniref:MCP methyltransferase, CheR-type n=1 Tax=Paenibacillus vortex V453 TaxID=715225 RepID=A0A2R9SUN2_9BACL|nr:MCP methyltransferase, CheR-type [Paenibacillus vortex V453]